MELRELTVSGTIMKCFWMPAPNQELIHAAFEENFIDDPLPRNGDTAPETRLHDAINRPNGKQLDPSLRFHGKKQSSGAFL